MELTVDLQKRLTQYHLHLKFRVVGETLGILGASGSGKSMTLRCIAGIDTPSKGTIALNHRLLYDAHKKINLPSRLRKVGFLFQNYALFPHLTVRQNIAYGLRNLPQWLVQQKVAEQLHKMQLTDLGDRYPHQLSGGQQQRVALARALAPEPDLLLLDEPFSALDTHLRNELEKNLIQTLTDYKGITLFVTHNLEEAYRVCQKLLVLDRGRVIAYGDKQQVFQHPSRLTVAQLTGCKNYSAIEAIDAHTVYALDWNCTLHVDAPLTPEHRYIGIRAHHLTFGRSPDQPNTFPAWVAWRGETPHRMTLYLKLQDPPTGFHDYHLQAEVFKEKWQGLREQPFPWFVSLESQNIMLLTP